MLRYWISGIMLATFFALPAGAAEIGQPAPAFEVRDIDDNPQSLSQYKGKIVVLEWNNPLCPFVRKHYGSGNMQKLQHYALAQGVVWLTVNSSAEDREGYMTPAEAREKIVQNGSIQTGYITDPQGKLGRLYGAKATPHMFVVDKNGMLAYQGAIDDKPTPDPADIASADNYVKDAVDALKAGRPVAMAKTRAYGCSVKYSD